VPVGGGLIYVPASWIKPAEMGVEELMTIYVSMGVSGPKKPPSVVATPAGQLTQSSKQT
jgi:uncharacterized membrane protein